MGWLWSSPAPPSEPVSQTSLPPSNPPLPASPDTPSSSTTTNSSPPSHKPTRDELADSEFRSLLEELEADLSPGSSKYNRVPQALPPHPNATSTSSSSTFPRSTVAKPQIPVTLEDSLLPQEMSCRQAFDAAFYCQSFGGQFNHVYRYGGIRSCSENWSDFWFCMRSKSMPTSPAGSGSLNSDGSPLSQKEESIRQHYKRKMLRYKVGPSSEDVWASRDEKLSWGEAFSSPIQENENVSDEQWNVLERERRQHRLQEIEGRS